MAEKPPLGVEERDILDIFPDHPLGRGNANGGRPGFLRVVLAVCILIAVAGGVVYLVFFSGGGGEGENGPLPVIRADDRAYKGQPKQPGGMEVPNQDKLVYDRIRPQDTTPQVERLLPKAESPAEPPAAPKPAETLKPAEPPPPAATVVVPPVETAPAAPVASEPPTVPTRTTPQALTPPAPTPLPAPPVSPAANKPAPLTDVPKAKEPPKPATKEPAPAKAAKAAPTPAAGGAFRIQVGALRERDEAERELARIQKSNSDLLGNLTPEIVTVEVDGKGTFYRMRLGSFASDPAARALCEQLAGRKVGCIVARN